MSNIIPFMLHHTGTPKTEAELHQDRMATRYRAQAISRTINMALQLAARASSRADILVFHPDHDTKRAVEHELGENKKFTFKLADGNGGKMITIARHEDGRVAFIPEEDITADWAKPYLAAA